MSQPNGPAVRCRGLAKRYGNVVALAGLDLEVYRGECFGMLGPNGAGKTTTIEICEGLNAPDEGEVEVLGETWHGDGHALRSRLGVQLQETKFPDKLRVSEVLALFRSFYPRGLTVSEALALVALQEKASAFVRTLSGGQKQRLSLACALIGDPELVFLDEPTTGLDPQSRRQAWDIVGNLRARGRTIVLTTHYMEEAERLCDRVVVVDQGKRIALGTPRELVATLGAEHVVEFAVDEAASARLAETAFQGLPSVAAVTRHGEGYRLTVREAHVAVPALLGALATAGAEPAGCLSHACAPLFSS